MNTRTQYDDDDERERGLLRDGERRRVPTYLMDSVQRALAVSDAYGRSSDAALSRPGPRFAPELTQDSNGPDHDELREFADAERPQSGREACKLAIGLISANGVSLSISATLTAALGLPSIAVLPRKSKNKPIKLTIPNSKTHGAVLTWKAWSLTKVAAVAAWWGEISGVRPTACPSWSNSTASRLTLHIGCMTKKSLTHGKRHDYARSKDRAVSRQWRCRG